MKKSSFLSIISLSVTLLLLVICAFGWFANNDEAKVNNGVAATNNENNYVFELYYYDGSKWELVDSEFNEYIPVNPGEKIYFNLVVHSLSDGNSTLKCEFDNITTSVREDIIYNTVDNTYCIEIADASYSLYSNTDLDCPWTYNSTTGVISAKKSITEAIVYQNCAFSNEELEFSAIENSNLEYEQVSITEAEFKADGSLYILNNGNYTPVTTGEYDNTQAYYQVLKRSLSSANLFGDKVLITEADSYYLYFSLEYLDLENNNPYSFQNISIDCLSISY